MSFWQILGIEPTKDVTAVKRAYAARSREVHPEDSPEEFRLLHEAYLAALAYARQTDTEEPEPTFAPAPVIEAPVAEAPEEKTPGYRNIVCSAELEEAQAVNTAVENALSRLEELIAARGSVDDYVAALGTPVTLGTRQTRVCFLAAFAAALGDFIQARKEFPDKLYEAVTLVYEFSPRLAPSPAQDLQSLYNVLRGRKRLMTRKERRLEKLSSIFIFTPFFFILCLFALKSSLEDAIFLPFIACIVTIIVAACIIGEKQKKPRAPGPYSAELRKLRQRRKLL